MLIDAAEIPVVAPLGCPLWIAAARAAIAASAAGSVCRPMRLLSAVTVLGVTALLLALAKAVAAASTSWASTARAYAATSPTREFGAACASALGDACAALMLPLRPSLPWLVLGAAEPLLNPLAVPSAFADFP